MLMTDLRALKRRGAALVGVGGNRLRLILLGILLILACFLPLILSWNLTDLFFGDSENGLFLMEEILFWCLMALLTVLITAPALTAAYRYAFWVLRREEQGILVPAQPRLGSYGELLRGGLLLLARPLAILGFFLGAYSLASLGDFVLYVPLTACSFLLSWLWMRVTACLFLLPYYLCLGETPKRAWARSCLAMEGKRKAYHAYAAGFFGLVLLSLLSVGVLLILYTLPLMLMTYFLLARRLTESIER